MKSDVSERAAALILAAWRTHRPIAALPEECRPKDLGEAYLCQSLVARELGAASAWKIGGLGPDKPRIFGPVFQVFTSPATLSGPQFRVLGIEGEIAVRLNRDLPRRAVPYAREDVLEAIESFHPAIEVVESRFVSPRDVDVFSLIADVGVTGALIVGEPQPRPKFDLARAPSRILVDGEIKAETTAVGNVNGNPITLLAECANHVAAGSAGLKRGDFVTTGSCTGIFFTHRGANVVADFGDFGTVRVAFRP